MSGANQRHCDFLRNSFKYPIQTNVLRVPGKFLQRLSETIVFGGIQGHRELLRNTLHRSIQQKFFNGNQPSCGCSV
eukprot:3618372-Pyramimonas_sp.AAC.1